MIAGHRSWCNGCGTVIVKGQEIARARRDGTFRHAACIDTADLPADHTEAQRASVDG